MALFRVRERVKVAEISVLGHVGGLHENEW